MKFLNKNLIFILLLAACGKGDDSKISSVKLERINRSRKFQQSDPAFDSYIQKFELNGRTYLKDATFEVGDILINFDDPEDSIFVHSGIQGICLDKTKEIIIRREWWEQVSKQYHESLIFHELGHCRLGRKHYDEEYELSKYEGIRKLSLMNGVLVVPSVFEEFETAYLRELFKCSPVYMQIHPDVEPCSKLEIETWFINK